jgi:uncharacterized membrane protein
MQTTTPLGDPSGVRASTPERAGEARMPMRRRSSKRSNLKLPDRGRRTQRLADGLALAGIGLGLAELLAPRSVARLVGVRDRRSVRRTMILMGLRELVCGLGLMAARRRGPWLWARVGGDLVDLAVLRGWKGSWRNDGLRLTGSMAAVAGIGVLDAITARNVTRLGREPIAANAVITIARVPEEVYRFWRDLRNLPRFMAHLASIEPTDELCSRWTAIGPGGVKVEWDAEIVEDRFGEAIAWRSLPGADVDNSGVVRFVPAPGGRGTEIHVKLRYAAPGGRVGRAIAKLLGREPEQQVHGDLRRLKQVLETGGIVHSDASIHAGPHPARPPSPEELAEIERARQEPRPHAHLGQAREEAAQ